MSKLKNKLSIRTNVKAGIFGTTSNGGNGGYGPDGSRPNGVSGG